MDTSQSMETLQCMRKQEVAYQCADYLHQDDQDEDVVMTGPLNDHADIAIDAECRFRMAEWCYQIVDFCKFKRETVEIAMSYLDRYLASPSGRKVLSDRHAFQLAAMTALYTAVKIHEAEAMDPKLMASLSRGAFSKDQVEWMESAMLEGIKWRLNPPTSAWFIHNALTLVSEKVLSKEKRRILSDLATFQTELAVGDYDLVSVEASSIAFAALLNAMESIDLDRTTCFNIEIGLAKSLNIDMTSVRMQDIRIRLFEAVEKEPGNEYLLRKLSSEVHENEVDCKEKETLSSFQNSPRSVNMSQRSV